MPIPLPLYDFAMVPIPLPLYDFALPIPPPLCDVADCTTDDRRANCTADDDSSADNRRVDSTAAL